MFQNWYTSELYIPKLWKFYQTMGYLATSKLPLVPVWSNYKSESSQLPLSSRNLKNKICREA